MKVHIVTGHRENFKPGKVLGVYRDLDAAKESIVKNDKIEVLYNKVNGEGIPTIVYRVDFVKTALYFTIQTFEV